MEVSSQIRKFRKADGLTIRALAEKVGVTESYISQLESGKANPSLGVLKKIAAALKINIVNFFAVDSHHEQVVVRESERREIVYPRGKIRAQLMVSKLSGKTMEPLYTIIEPGGDTSDPYHHGENGEEFGVIIKGELLLTVDDEEYHLKAGDSFYFETHRPHRWANPGDITTEIVWVISPPNF